MIAFDGFYLSTKREDGILKQVAEMDASSPAEYADAFQEVYNRKYEKVNMATIGFRLFDESEHDEYEYKYALDVMVGSMKNKSDLGVGENSIPFPDTEKSHAYQKELESIRKSNEQKGKFQAAFMEFNRWLVEEFAEALSKHGRCDHPKGYNTVGLLRVLKETPPKESIRPNIFGLDTWDDVVSQLDSDRKVSQEAKSNDLFLNSWITASKFQ